MRIESLLVLICLILVSITSDAINPNRIVIAQYQLFLDSYYMFSKHGSPSNNFYLALDITSPLTRLSKVSYGYHRSNSNFFLQNTTIKLHKGVTLIGTEYEDQLGINKTIIPKLSYIVTEKNSLDFSKNNLYAMAYKIKDTNHSITHQLKSYGLIDHLSFSFNKRMNKTGSIYFGGIPKDVIKGLYNTSITVKGKNEANWDCSLPYVFIGRISYIARNNYYANRYPAYFATKLQEIIVPTDFYSQFMKIFKQAFEKRHCVTKYSKQYEVECDCKIIGSFPSINFVIDNRAIKLTPRDYFTKGDKKCSLIITNNTKGNVWVFGLQFISKYHTTFDYENEEIVLYDSKNFRVVDLDLLFPKKQLYKWTVIIIFILLLALLWKCLQLMWRKRSNNKYTNRLIKTSKQRNQV